MNILAGISLAAAGIGAARKAYRSLGASAPGDPKTAGSALLSEFSFSRGQFNWKREPRVKVIKSEADLLKEYLESGPPVPPKEGETPFWKLERSQQEQIAREQAAIDWRRMSEESKSAVRVAAGQDPLVYEWDIFSRPISRSRTSIKRSRQKLVYDESRGGYVYKNPGDFTYHERALARDEAALVKVQKQLRESLYWFRSATGQNWRIDYAGCAYMADRVDPQIRRAFVQGCTVIPELAANAVVLKKAVRGHRANIQAKLAATAVEDMVSRGAALRDRLIAEGRAGKDDIVLVKDGVVRISDPAYSLSMNAEQLAESMRQGRADFIEASRKARTPGSLKQLTKLPENDPERVSVETVKAFWEAVEEEEREIARMRRTAGQDSGERTIGVERREFIPTPREIPKGKKKSRNPKGLRGTEGMDDASGLVAPGIAVVDGLGAISRTDSTLGIVSLGLIAIGAYTLFQMVEPEQA